VAVSPNLPGLGYSIGLQTNAQNVQTDSVRISEGAKNVYTFDWLFGFVTSVVLYTVLSWVWPAKETLVESTVYGDVVDGVGSDDEGGGHESGVISVGGSEARGEKDRGDVGAVDLGVRHRSGEKQKEEMGVVVR